LNSALEQVSLKGGENALAAGNFRDALNWLDAIPSERKPTDLVALCFDGLSREAAFESRWNDAEQSAKLALTSQSTPFREARLAALRRRTAVLELDQAETIGAAVPPPQRLDPQGLRPDIREVHACGRFHSRGRDSGAPWSRYLRMGKKSQGEDKDREAIFRLAAGYMAYDIANRTDLLRHVEVAVPIPPNPERYALRLTSFPSEVANGIGSILALIVLSDALGWNPEATHLEMKKLTGSERREASRLAFIPGAGISAVKNRSVLLVDDILTTGGTLQSCGRILLAAGAREVYAYCLAHTEG
jgi:hypothetical protein